MNGVQRVMRRRAVLGLRSGVILALLLLGSAAVEARPYLLEWDANTDGVTTGYRVYIGTAPGDYVPLDGIDVGNVLEHQLNLTPGITYYLVVRAYNESLVLGPPSTELVFTVPNVAPVLTNPGLRANAPGNVVSLNLLATDADGDGLTFTSVTGLPPGLSANGNGQITGTITAGGAGTYTVSATVSDGAAQDVESFTWRVLSFSSSAGSIEIGQTVSAVVNHGPGNAGDWVGLYRVGAPIGQYHDWSYLNGTKVRPGAGVTSATVNFATGGASGGSYELRYFLNDSATVMATTTAITFVATQSVTLTVNGVVPPTPVTAAGGSVLTTQIAVSGPTYAGDWVGLYRAGATVGQVLDWKYLNGTQTRPAAGTSNATVTFTMPATAGTYEIRFYSNDSSSLVGTSSQLTSQTTGTIAVNGTLPPAGVTTVGGSTLTVDVTITGSNYPADWIGLYTVGGPVGQHHNWMYLNGTQVLPGSGSSSASLVFTVPSTSGPFELRLYSNGSSSLITTSSTIATQTAVISVNDVDPPAGLTVSGGSTLTTDVVISGPHFAGDWVGLYPVGGTIGQWIDWKYLNGTQVRPGGGSAAATVTFTAPSTPGNYQIRLYANDSAALVSTSSTVTVSAAQTAAIAVNGVSPPTVVNASTGSVLTVDVTMSGAAFAGDWVGLFSVGGASSQPIAWRYMNNTQVRPGAGFPSGTVNLTLPAGAGNYEVRVFSNDSLSLVGTSSTINAQ